MSASLTILPSDSVTLVVSGADGRERWRAELGMIAANIWTAPPTAPEPTRPRVIGYGQRDPRWAAVRLGASQYRMGDSGCAVTSACMVGSQARPEVTPLELVNWLNLNGGFTADGRLFWSKVGEFYAPSLRFVKYTKWESAPADLSYLREALKYHAQVVQVDFKPETAPLDSHFVCALDFTQDGKDLLIYDPWRNERGTLLTMYAKPQWALSRAVYALAEFTLHV